MTTGKLYIGGVNQDDQRCLRCGADALDTGWECNECGYDNQPHYYNAPDKAAQHSQESQS